LDLFKAFSDKGKYFQAHIFYIGRDFQESFGWLLSLFNDRLGQFHIQGSEFHKTCYDNFLANVGQPDSRDVIDLNLKPDTETVQGRDKSDDPSTQLNGSSPPLQSVPPPSQQLPPLRDLDAELEAIRALSKGRSTDNEQEKRFALLAQAYLARGDKEKALSTIKRLFNDRKTRDSFIVQMAYAYFDKG